jgi:proteasome accessory factor C
MLPWLAERQDVPVAEVAARFKLTEAEVISDLERAAMCGVPPFGPDDLVDLFVEDGIVHCGPPRFFTRPLRLTAPEGFALLTAARAAQQLPGGDPTGALARALDKLASAIGGDAVAVELSRPQHTDEIARAVDERAQLTITYWSAASDEVTERVVDPSAVFTDRGNWYLAADDHRSGERRTFRVDRIESVTRTGTLLGVDEAPGRSLHVDLAGNPAWFAGADDLPSATLRLAPHAMWVAERHPVRSVVERDDGHVDVVVPVTSERWLARVLLAAGTGASVLEPEEWRDLAATTAARLLVRYRSMI